MLIDWLTSAGLLDDFPQRSVIEWAIEEPITDLSSQDDATLSKLAAGREAVNFIASRMSAYDFFIAGQARNMQVAIIYSPEEVLSDPHIVARGFPVKVAHPELDREILYPGAPYIFEKTPVQVDRRAPLLGEHTDEVLTEWKAGS